jgi:hypothetical protein
MAFLLGLLGAGGAAGGAADAAAGAAGAGATGGAADAAAGAGLGAGASSALGGGGASAAPSAAAGLGSAQGGSILGDVLGPILKGLGGSGGAQPPLSSAGAPDISSVLNPPSAPPLNMVGNTGLPGGSSTGGFQTPYSGPVGSGAAMPPAGGATPGSGFLSSLGSGIQNAATSFFTPPQGGSIWQSPFGQYLLQRHGIGSQQQPGAAPMNPMLQQALISGIGNMVGPAYARSGMGNPFTFNPMGPQFQQ